MFIRFLKENPLAALFISPLLAMAIWLYSYQTQFTVIETGTPVYESLFYLVNPSYKKLVFAVAALILILSQAIHLNYLLIKHEVFYKRTWMISLFYILLMSIIPQFLVFNPILIINSIIIFQLGPIFRLYKNTDTFAIDFNVCAMTGIATMFYIPSVLLLLLYFIAILILKPFSWRDWVIGILGLLTPYFFLFVYFFLTDQYNYLSLNFFKTNIQQQFDFLKIFPRNFSFSVVYIVMLMLMALLKLSGNFYKNVIRSRNYIQVMILMIPVIAGMVMISTETMLFRFSILCIPFSAFITYYFVAAKRAIWYETLFILLIANIIFNYYMALY